MKLQLIYDFYDRDDGEDVCCDGEYYGYATDVHTNSKLPHENKTFNEEVHRKMSKYFKHSARTDNRTLVEIPDDIMFQFMIDGVYDYDYIAYNMIDGRICISNTKQGACRYGNDEYGYGCSNNADGDEEKFFKFNLDNSSKLDKERDSRNSYMIVPDGEHYKNIHEVLMPYIVYRFVQHFKMGVGCISQTQVLNSVRSEYEYETEEICYEVHSNGEYIFSGSQLFDDDETNCRRTWDMSSDTFVLCLQFWVEDHPIFLAAKDFISDRDVEIYKLFYNKIMSKITETKC